MNLKKLAKDIAALQLQIESVMNGPGADKYDPLDAALVVEAAADLVALVQENSRHETIEEFYDDPSMRATALHVLADALSL
jgi:hypothetical protein